MWLTQAIRPLNQRLLEVDIAEPAIATQTSTAAGIQDVHAIFIGAGSKAVRFEFVDFVSYAVTEEMYLGHSCEGGASSGWIKRFETSYFLEFVACSTWATRDYPGALSHYQINTLDHRVDVVTSQSPEITKITPVPSR